jgi:hypothetical protein
VIARDIYSQDTHFLLELIQNADDNAYVPGVVPSLLFDTSADCIVVRNNEKVGNREHSALDLADLAVPVVLVVDKDSWSIGFTQGWLK